jgi:predicted RNA binding protein YcfA (HicA-like mRNA interferase family)
MTTKQLVKVATQHGWRTDTRRSGHVVFYSPNGVDMVTVGGTPGRSAWLPTRARFRQYGLMV